MRRLDHADQQFEVISDVLFVLGNTFGRGDRLSNKELGDLAEKLVKLGMVRLVRQARRAA